MKETELKAWDNENSECNEQFECPKQSLAKRSELSFEDHCKQCNGSIDREQRPLSLFCSKSCTNKHHWKSSNKKALVCKGCKVRMAKGGRYKYCSKGCRRKFEPPHNWTSREHQIVASAKLRASKKGVPFSITASDIIIPTTCPVLGIELRAGKGRPIDSSPSLDRIDPNLGYIPTNIRIISHKANTLKSNGTLEEFRLLIVYLERLRSEGHSVR
jgi:hypothetical protein